jgi:hypothetical protein
MRRVAEGENRVIVSQGKAIDSGECWIAEMKSKGVEFV